MSEHQRFWQEMIYKSLIGHYNNHSGAYVYSRFTNYIGTYIIMASLQALVNNLLVWQSSCASKLHKYICPRSAYNQNINKRLARILGLACETKTSPAAF